LHQTLHAYSLRSEREHRKVKTPENVLSSRPGEGGSRSTETKYDRRAAQRQKLFVSARTLQEQRPQLRKTALSSSQRDVFRSFKTKQVKSSAKTKIFVSPVRLCEQRPEHGYPTWVPVSVKIISLPRTLGMTEEGQD
jgi:hypothetical protein